MLAGEWLWWLGCIDNGLFILSRADGLKLLEQSIRSRPRHVPP